MLLMISMVKKLLDHFIKNNWKKTNQKGFSIGKEIKKKKKKQTICQMDW